MDFDDKWSGDDDVDEHGWDDADHEHGNDDADHEHGNDDEPDEEPATKKQKMDFAVDNTTVGTSLKIVCNTGPHTALKLIFARYPTIDFENCL